MEDSDYDCDKIGIPEDLKPRSFGTLGPCVSVQPLLSPATLHYYARYRYSDNTAVKSMEVKPGYPTDDPVSIQQGSGDANLDHFYGSMLHQENISCSGELEHSKITLEKSPVVKQSMLGNILLNGVIAFTFTLSSIGQLQILTLCPSELRIIAGWIDLNTGVMEINWSHPPGPFELKLSYEYPR